MQSLIHLFFPKICYACGKPLGKNIDHICLQCRYEIPRTNAYGKDNNPIEKIFWGRLEIERATSFLRFQKKGKIQNLIYHFKYKGIKEIGISLGSWAANELSEVGFFQGIDGIVPIPIHKNKKRKRGYNQSDFIAQGIFEATGIPINSELIYKSIHTSSQTKKGRYKRWENVLSSFSLNKDLVQSATNQHLLLVDDVLTTGATIEACGKVLKEIPRLKLSLLTIASTY